MSKVARILNGKVENLAEVDAGSIPTHLSASQGWVSAPDECAIGWLFDGTTFSAPPVKSAVEIDQDADSMADEKVGEVLENPVLRGVVIGLVDVIEAVTGANIPLTQVRDRVKQRIKEQLLK